MVFGIVCCQLLLGDSPFKSRNYEELINKLKNDNFTIPQNLQLSYEAVSFINSMLHKDNKKRKSISYLKDHPFLNVNFNSFHKIKLNQVIVNDEDSSNELSGIWEGINSVSVDTGMPVDCKNQFIEYVSKPIPENDGIYGQPKKLFEDFDNLDNNNNTNIHFNHNNENNQKIKLSDNFVKFIKNEFDIANKHYKYVDSMFIPFLPENIEKYCKIEY